MTCSGVRVAIKFGVSGGLSKVAAEVSGSLSGCWGLVRSSKFASLPGGVDGRLLPARPTLNLTALLCCALKAQSPTLLCAGQDAGARHR